MRLVSPSTNLRNTWNSGPAGGRGDRGRGGGKWRGRAECRLELGAWALHVHFLRCTAYCISVTSGGTFDGMTSMENCDGDNDAYHIMVKVHVCKYLNKSRLNNGAK